MDMQVESKRSLERIIESSDLTLLSKTDQKVLLARIDEHFPGLFTLLFEIYGHRYDFYFYLNQLVQTLMQGYAERSGKLKIKDQQRLSDPHWFKRQNMLGMACYVDLFANDLPGMLDKIPYLQELGVTYLHLMPLYDSPKGDSDGGYAVSDYRKVNPILGTSNDLEKLANALSENGISLVLDFVFNHTSDEHKWAELAKSGEQEFKDYYYMFDDRTLPDQYELNLREIFPQVRRGNFTWNDDAQKWVWTTFNNFQWDLNYTNPAVFNAITSEMLYLANLGCEGLRLDALAFIWKEMGTTCENQEKAHLLIQAFNCCLKIAAPAVVFKSEAIVHPDEVIKYIDQNECQLSYNPLLMALIWNSLATRKTKLLTESLQKSFPISEDCTWVNYVRCHDDIGWTFDDSVAWHLGINGSDHRHFLNQFYTGRFEGSFSTGVAFAENPTTGDCRVCGSLASLAGLEQGLLKEDQHLIDNAVARILLVHAIILSIGGIPLLYSGDELGLLNDYDYKEDPSKQHDDRWVHRIAVDDNAMDQLKVTDSPQKRVADGLQKLIKLRKTLAILGDAETLILSTNNHHIFTFVRHDSDGNSLLVLCNFSEELQLMDSKVLDHVSHGNCRDLITNLEFIHGQDNINLNPYQVAWIVKSAN